MGNSHNKPSQYRNHSQQSSHFDRQGRAYSSQITLSHFVGNLSGRSFISVGNNQSTSNASRPWSRVSRKKWNEATLSNPLEASKTAWPVAYKESIFLPEFPIQTEQQRDFEIIKVIAKGAFGEVFKVKKLDEDKEYALKVLQKTQVVKENALRQVKDEARIQEVCGHHPLLVGAVARWQDKKALYIVSEYIPGGELLALLEKYGKLPEELVKLFLAQIAAAIDFLHGAGVVHRDVKPENILVGERGLRLADLGLARWLPAGIRCETIAGSRRYMAPEVTSGQYGHAADWWSLGVVACLMLTDEFPSSSAGLIADGEKNESSICHNTSKEPDHTPGQLPNSSETLSKSARSLLLHLLERDPRHRLRNLRQLKQSPFYFGYHFDDALEMKVSITSLLETYFPDGPPQKINDDVGVHFENFDHSNM